MATWQAESAALSWILRKIVIFFLVPTHSGGKKYGQGLLLPTLVCAVSRHCTPSVRFVPFGDVLPNMYIWVALSAGTVPCVPILLAGTSPCLSGLFCWQILYPVCRFCWEALHPVYLVCSVGRYCTLCADSVSRHFTLPIWFVLLAGTVPCVPILLAGTSHCLSQCSATFFYSRHTMKYPW
jgi:hypothetical protein